MKKADKKPSAFEENGLSKTIRLLTEEIQELYISDSIPWVIGYSGGKDSTAVLQLIWMALQKLPINQCQKPVYVISTDTLVENPVVAAWVNQSLKIMKKTAQTNDLPFEPHRLTPKTKNTFWVNLIGKGYPAPRHKFRWCTDRLKIQPSNHFINNVVSTNGEAILVLGTRKAESATRAKTMEKYEAKRYRDKLSPNATLPNTLVYTPIENWLDDDVWLFLMQFKNPWGYNNKELLTMYQGASADGECPLVVDTTTPSCGNSRFGCWVCTMVDKDKSMQAMIQNDEEKEWMMPLLELRNALDLKDDRHLRDFRRLQGHTQLFNDRLIPGPYLQYVREDWLRRVLRIQKNLQKDPREYIRNVELIGMDEMHEIRRIWVFEKHEVEDKLPQIYEEEMEQPFPERPLDDNMVFGLEEMQVLKEVCDDNLQFEMARELLEVERRYRTMNRRAKLYQNLEEAIRRSFYTDEEEATARALDKRSAFEKINELVEAMSSGEYIQKAGCIQASEDEDS